MKWYVIRNAKMKIKNEMTKKKLRKYKSKKFMAGKFDLLMCKRTVGEIEIEKETQSKRNVIVDIAID